MVKCLRTTNILINPKISTNGNYGTVSKALYFSVFPAQKYWVADFRAQSLSMFKVIMLVKVSHMHV